MMRKKAFARQLMLLTAIAGMTFFTTVAQASMNATKPDIPGRADVIDIDTMTAFGPIERPAVEFLHDKHVHAVEKMGKDCLACHPQNDDTGRLNFRYIRIGDMDKKASMDTYHARCITCHNEQLSAGETSGPIVCAGCHDKMVKTVSNRQAFGMDKSLHFRHIRKTKGGCCTCHHVYDAETKKLIYKRHAESTCRYCHPDRTEDIKLTMRDASHTACVGCHQSMTAQNESTGPIECAGCHDAARQARIEKLAKVPRIKTGQPDSVFVGTGTSANSDRMNPVPFDHKAHETYNDTCRVCHHASLAGCADCHTEPGKKEGAWVTLEQAMHQNKTGESCVGCHERKQAESACAGCHGFMTASGQKPETYCATCHIPPPAQNTAPEAEPSPMPSARDALAARTPTGTYDMAEIPETVTIKSLSKTFEPVELPHGQIVSTLLNGIENNKLAVYFHTEQGTLCRGCHHNSPASKTPPRCVACHDKPFQESDLSRPGLMAAYHQQCMRCHNQMGIEQPASRDCAGCHIKKQGSQTQN